MNDHTSIPYANLDPSVILTAIEQLGFDCDGHLLALNSFENRVYQVGLEDAAPIIVKFYRPNRWSDAAILEEHAFATELQALDIPIIAPLALQGTTLHTYQTFRFALFPRQGGRPFESDNLEQLEWIGRYLGRIHAVGASRSFTSRMTLSVETYGWQPYRFIMDQQRVPEELRTNYQVTVEALLSAVTRCMQSIDEVRILRLHGDCHPGNILWGAAGPCIVDLDDCLMGPAVQDIWMLLPGYGKETDIPLQRLLSGYREFYDFDMRELRMIEALRSLRMVHYAGWLAKRWDDPAFPLNFPWFNTPRYWQEQLQHLREQWATLEQAMEA